MSIELHEEGAGKLLTVKLSGKLTSADYEHFVPAVNRAVEQHGKIRMLVRMHDFHGWTMGALWQDIKFDLKHFRHIERIAFVGDRKWEHGMAVFCKPFTTATIRYFDENSCSEAVQWVQEGLPVAVGPGRFTGGGVNPVGRPGQHGHGRRGPARFGQIYRATRTSPSFLSPPTLPPPAGTTPRPSRLWAAGGRSADGVVKLRSDGGNSAFFAQWYWLV